MKNGNKLKMQLIKILYDVVRRRVSHSEEGDAPQERGAGFCHVLGVMDMYQLRRNVGSATKACT